MLPAVILGECFAVIRPLRQPESVKNPHLNLLLAAPLVYKLRRATTADGPQITAGNNPMHANKQQINQPFAGPIV
jgi:hypothetical protein